MIINYDELVEYVVNETELEKETVEKVLDTESDFLKSKGVIVDEGEEMLSHKEECEKGMTFGEALEAVKQGGKVARCGWNGKGMWVACEKIYTHTDLKVQDVESTFSHPILIIKNVNGKFATWVPSVSDLFAEDWTIIE